MSYGIKNDWEEIINYGRITATYKFALAKSIIALADKGKIVVGFAELADYYTSEIRNHLKHYKKQITAKSSKFLEACSDYTEGLIDINELRDITIRIGFFNVLERFHNINQEETNTKFFEYEKKAKKLYITDSMFKLVNEYGKEPLKQQVEQRWKEVEIKWNV